MPFLKPSFAFCQPAECHMHKKSTGELVDGISSVTKQLGLILTGTAERAFA
jgi:hypothetical protein